MEAKWRFARVLAAGCMHVIVFRLPPSPNPPFQHLPLPTHPSNTSLSQPTLPTNQEDYSLVGFLPLNIYDPVSPPPFPPPPNLTTYTHALYSARAHNVVHGAHYSKRTHSVVREHIL